MTASESGAAGALLTVEQVAERLNRHRKTLIRLLPELMDHNPALRARRVGRSLMFTERDFALLVEGLAWRSASANAAKSGTRAARSGSGTKASSSPSSAQERLAERLRSKRPSVKRQGSEPITLTALPGGRAA